MRGILYASIGFWIFLVLICVLVALKKDRVKMVQIAESLGLRLRPTFFNGWLAETENKDSKVWISRWEDFTATPGILMVFNFTKPLPFPLKIINRSDHLSKTVLAKVLSRSRHLKRFDESGVTEGLVVMCTEENSERCRGLLRATVTEMESLRHEVERVDGLFWLESSRLKVGLALGTEVTDAKKVYNIARCLAERLTSLI